jgi:hypothetical protein
LARHDHFTRYASGRGVSPMIMFAGEMREHPREHERGRN